MRLFETETGESHRDFPKKLTNFFETRLIFGGTSYTSPTFPILCAPVARPEGPGRIRTISQIVRTSTTSCQALTQIPSPAVRNHWRPFVSIRGCRDRIEQNRTISEISETGPLQQRHLRRRLYKSFDFRQSEFFRHLAFDIRRSSLDAFFDI